MFDVTHAEQFASADWATFHTRVAAGVAITPDAKWAGATGTGGADYQIATFAPAGGGGIDLYIANTAHDSLLVGDVYADVSSNSGPDKHIYMGLIMFTSPAFNTDNSPWSVAER